MPADARVGAGSRRRSGKAQRTLIITLTLIFLGFAGVSRDAAGQGFGQNQGPLPTNPQANRFPENVLTFPRTTQKQKQALLDYNFKKLKKHAENLAKLANSLSKEIEKSNENVLSLEIVKKAEEVEKLAKKVKDEAKGY